MSRSKDKPLLEKLLIEDVASEGKAIARYQGMVVFVSLCVPGDVVDVQVIRKRKRYMEGYPVKYHEYSPDRAEPFCEHFGICGGCKWQHLPYPGQLKLKQRQVSDDLERIGKVDTARVLPIIGAETQQFYRNKLEFTFSANRWLTQSEIQSGQTGIERRGLGFHIPGKFDKVLDIQHCYLQPEPSNQIRNFVRRYAIENKLPFFDLLKQEGLLRNLIIRNNSAGEVMTIFSFYREDKAIEELLDAVAKAFPQITSLMYVINPKGNDTLNDLEIKLHKGADHLIEVMDDLKFRISPKSFFQTNTSQAFRLYNVVREFAGLTGKELVYDLYTGTGTIALFLARHCRQVIGAEYVREATDDANINARLNNITNAVFYTGDIREIFTASFLS
ncbi:MAG: 23S rRNA (uracil(1939)-C(5))-methyltransferase RlmD, partial [Bacteroidales bacterium]|nr:23S rRNA (uracil(1939)-C(5))-methyltransferase RlmD [Bacteroidales bacterium]